MNVDPEDRLQSHLEDPRVKTVHISNRLRRSLEISKKAAQRTPKLRVHHDLPGSVIVAVLSGRKDNVTVTAYDDEGEAFAREFEASPDWTRLGL